jgi:maleylacetoacetate isomerase
MKLYGYYRSSASYRVRIALNLKGLGVDHLPRKGEQLAPEYLALNPQGLVPTVKVNQNCILTQSLAIIEWLNETYPLPAIQPVDSIQRARVRAFYRAQRVLRTAHVQLQSRAIGEHIYHSTGAHAKLRNQLMGAKTSEDFYEHLAWLYGGTGLAGRRATAENGLTIR